ncbi:predicted protein [Histoplasma capsulatum G186AR]|uniref:Uncharacterized protein n=1 Tax=Ajellomyces capsulatus (strain G186AR / H82 / ATCC MYA-2454 / RMSCC 2432) TaxID=447093 RepID=C0NMA0_AJECG|nr:uncharacterized protein HCBG_04630 [Histoplasma capsulatum G186AR]EEH07751.1 predicted protein [Histoplasma capsulatum G186AR]
METTPRKHLKEGHLLRKPMFGRSEVQVSINIHILRGLNACLRAILKSIFVLGIKEEAGIKRKSSSPRISSRRVGIYIPQTTGEPRLLELDHNHQQVKWRGRGSFIAHDQTLGFTLTCLQPLQTLDSLGV